VQQTFSFTRDPNTELVTAETDPLGRNFSYGHDTSGNLTSVICSNCLANSITSSATYEPVFSGPTSITDALNHTWTIGYDTRGNPTRVTDPLSYQITLGYNFQGQLTSITDALNDTASFGYSYGDLATSPTRSAISFTVTPTAPDA
jgi:YD repeat-containing protein